MYEAKYTCMYVYIEMSAWVYGKSLYGHVKNIIQMFLSEVLTSTVYDNALLLTSTHLFSESFASTMLYLRMRKCYMTDP